MAAYAGPPHQPELLREQHSGEASESTQFQSQAIDRERKAREEGKAAARKTKEQKFSENLSAETPTEFEQPEQNPKATVPKPIQARPSPR